MVKRLLAAGRPICLFLVLQLSAHAQLLFSLSADTLQVFRYAGGDEFSGAQLNTTYWRGPWTCANMAQNFYYDANNVKQSDGVLQLELKRQDSVYVLRPHEIDSNYMRKSGFKIEANRYQPAYSAGMIVSREKLHYGHYELRFKVEEGQGVWPAFWFYGGAANEEIDAFELKGERDREIHVDTHCPSGCDKGYKNRLGLGTNWGGWLPLTAGLHNGFVMVSLDWKPGEVSWSINGHPLAWFKGDFSNAMNLFLNTQVASSYSAFQPGPKPQTPLPNVFSIDYVRIWQPAKAGDQLVLVPSELQNSARFPSNYALAPAKKRGLMYQRSRSKKEMGTLSLSLSTTGKLMVTVLGDIATRAETITLRGKRDYVVTERFSESEFDLGADENELELVIRVQDKTFQRKFTIRR